MGAKTGDLSDPRQRQLAREGMRMRQESIRQRQQAPSPQAGEASMFPGIEPTSAFAPGTEAAPMVPTGIDFGPGRARRFPEQGTPDYQAMVERMRSRGGRR